MVNVTVDTDGVTGDFAGFVAFVTSLPSLLTDNYTVTVQASTGVGDNVAGISWHTINFGGYKIVVQAASGHETVKEGWDGTRYRMYSSGSIMGFNNFLGGYTQDIEFIGVQAETLVGAGSDPFVISGNQPDHHVVFSRCRLRNNTTVRYCFLLLGTHASATGLQFFNCIFGDGATANDYHFLTLSQGNYRVGNCVFLNLNMAAIAHDAGTAMVVDNCVAEGDLMEITVGTPTGQNNSGDDDWGTNPIDPKGDDITNEYPGIGSGDVTLVSDGNFVGAGIDLSAYFTTDVDGETRVSWDIGPDEWIVLGATHQIEKTVDAFVIHRIQLFKTVDALVIHRTQLLKIVDAVVVLPPGYCSVIRALTVLLQKIIYAAFDRSPTAVMSGTITVGELVEGKQVSPPELSSSSVPRPTITRASDGRN